MKEKTISCILDVDPGHDDAVAILLAAASSKIDLKAILTVAGNQTLEKTTQNALRVCSLGKITTPVYKGMDQPMFRRQVIAEDVHGITGLDGTELPLNREVEQEHAVWYLTQVLPKYEEPITMIITGPMTNLAMAFKLNPKIKEKIEKIVFMGGAYGLGNVTPSAEFNIFADPEAAQIVLQSGIPFTMIGLDVTHQALVYDSVLERLSRIGGGVGEKLVPLLKFFKQRYKQVFHFDHPPLHDPIAVAYVIDPQIMEAEPCFVEVATHRDITYGRTVCDLGRVTGHSPNGEVGKRLDVERFWNLVVGTLTEYFGQA